MIHAAAVYVRDVFMVMTFGILAICCVGLLYLFARVVWDELRSRREPVDWNAVVHEHAKRWKHR